MPDASPTESFWREIRGKQMKVQNTDRVQFSKRDFTEQMNVWKKIKQ